MINTFMYPETKICPFCAEEIKKEAIFCKYCKTDLVTDTKVPIVKFTKQITENRVTCIACGNIWYFGRADVNKNISEAVSNCSSNLMCCGGCLPALWLKRKEIVDFNKCPKCGSKAVKAERVTHNV